MHNILAGIPRPLSKRFCPIFPWSPQWTATPRDHSALPYLDDPKWAHFQGLSGSIKWTRCGSHARIGVALWSPSDREPNRLAPVRCVSAWVADSYTNNEPSLPDFFFLLLEAGCIKSTCGPTARDTRRDQSDFFPFPREFVRLASVQPCPPASQPTDTSDFFFFH